MPPPSVPLDAIRQPAVLYDARGRIVAANDMADALADRPLAGLSAAELAGIFSVRSPGGTPLPAADLAAPRALAGEVVVGVPLAITLAGGRTLEILATASPVRDGDAVTGALVVWQDVTARAAGERALRESREKYQALIETNVDFVWETDAEGRYTYCSPQMERLWGIRPEEMNGRTPFDRMPPGDRMRALAAFTEMAGAPGGFSGMETTSYDGRGNVIALETSGVPFFDDGTLLGYRGITRDVTERVRAGEALRESEEELRSILDRSLDALYRRDLVTGRSQYFSPAIEAITGFSVEECLAMDVADIVARVHPDDRPPVVSGKLEVASGSEGGTVDYRFLCRDGTYRWLSDRFRIDRDEDGRPLRREGVIRDINDRRLAEEALVESEADARSFFENMVDACAVCEMVVDSRGEPVDLRLVDVNPAFEQALSLPADLIVGQTAFMILPTLHREWLDLFLEVSRNRTFVAVEEPFPALDRRYHVTGFPVRHGRVAVVFRDITG